MIQKYKLDYFVFAIVSALTLGSGIFFFGKSPEALAQLSQNYFSLPADLSQNPSEQDLSCETKIYKTEVEIGVWYEDFDGEKFLRVADEDMWKLPNYKNGPEFSEKYSILKIIDADKKLKKKLSNASEKKPRKVVIQGYATRCTGPSLAAISYQEGVFGGFLAVN